MPGICVRRLRGQGRGSMRGQLLVVQFWFLEAGSSLQGGAGKLQGGVCQRNRTRTVRPGNSNEEKGNFGEGTGNERTEEAKRRQLAAPELERRNGGSGEERARRLSLTQLE